MAYFQIRQDNQLLEDEIATSPPRSILSTGTLHDHVQENLRIQSAASNGQFEASFANIPPAAGEVVVQGYQQDPLYIDVPHNDMSVGYYHRPQPGDPAVPYLYHDAAGAAQDIQAQPQAIQVQFVPETRGNNNFGSVPEHLASGPARDECPDVWAHHAPVRDYPQTDSADDLGRLARGYMDQPDSQVMQVDRVVRMEPGHVRRLRVVVTLEMPNAL